MKYGLFSRESVSIMNSLERTEIILFSKKSSLGQRVLIRLFESLKKKNKKTRTKGFICFNKDLYVLIRIYLF